VLDKFLVAGMAPMHENLTEKIPCSMDEIVLRTSHSSSISSNASNFCSLYSNMIKSLLFLFLDFGLGVKMGSQGILDGIDLGNSNVPTARPYSYQPSNKNTRPPSTFADEIVVDTSYHELVPALAVLSDLTTTTTTAEPR
jgi:hypothetical protein